MLSGMLLVCQPWRQALPKVRCREGTRRPLRLFYSSRKLRHTSIGVKLASMSMPTLVYRYTDTPVQRHTGTLAHWYTGTLFHRCTNAQVHRYTGTLVHRDTDTLIHWYTSTLVTQYTGTPVQLRAPFSMFLVKRELQNKHYVHKPLSVLTHGPPECQYTGTLAHPYTGTWEHRYTCTQVHRYIGIKLHA